MINWIDYLLLLVPAVLVLLFFTHPLPPVTSYVCVLREGPFLADPTTGTTGGSGGSGGLVGVLGGVDIKS